MDVGLWAARIERSLTEREESAMLRLLPESRRQRLLRVQKSEKRAEVLCAYTVLHLALRERYGWRTIPEMTVSSMGKPRFLEYSGVHFNISHTAGAVLVGLSDEPVGVDIERIRPVSERAMRRIAGVESEKAFFQSWVRREALAKRAGAGIGMLMGETVLRDGEEFFFVDTFDGYAAGVAVGRGTIIGKVHRYFLDDL
ncbi:MAG: 4'-phosphopantetheinyl transferase [Ruminococcaceae bacterium]|nr:4'-phosphopantetheinyl transferase [Oscillospiraceae bacterium]